MFVVFITACYVSVVKHNIFFLMIGFFSFYLVHSGIRVNRFRLTGLVSTIDKIFVVFYALVFFLIVSLSFLTALKSNWTPAIILGVFGAVGASLSYTDIKIYLLRKAFSQKALIKDHIGRMSGSYIAATTAFLVNNVYFLPPLILWLGPTLIGTLIIGWFSKPYKD